MARTFAGKRYAWLLAMLSCMVMSCAAVGGEESAVKPAQVELRGDGPFERFIVRYRDGGTAVATQEDAIARIGRTAAKAPVAPGVAATWQRRLAVHADLFTVDRPLDRDEALALMQAFANDPEVEYIEVDAKMGIGPVPGPAPRPPRD